MLGGTKKKKKKKTSRRSAKKDEDNVRQKLSRRFLTGCVTSEKPAFLANFRPPSRIFYVKKNLQQQHKELFQTTTQPRLTEADREATLRRIFILKNF